MDLRAHPDVYEPAEDSYLLVRAIRDLGSLAGKRALDVGTGSGIAALALAQAQAERVLAIDVNPHACRLARDNLRDGGHAARADVARGDLLTALCTHARFDVVTFNAPYLPSQPEERVPGPIDHAFHGGPEGVEVAQRLVRALPNHLAPGGVCLLVVSTRGNLDRLRKTCQDAGLTARVVAHEAFFFERVEVWSLKAEG